MLSAATPLTKSLTICRVRSSRSHRPRRLCQAAYSVVFDEPTSALSVRETNKVLTIMREIADAGASCVFVTHNIYHAYQVCDRFVVMAHGAVRASVTKAEITLDALTNMIMEH